MGTLRPVFKEQCRSDISELQNHVQRVFASEKVGLSKEIGNIFVLAAGDGEQKSMFCVAKLLCCFV